MFETGVIASVPLATGGAGCKWMRQAWVRLQTAGMWAGRQCIVADMAHDGIARYPASVPSGEALPVNPERLQNLGAALSRAARASLNREFAEVVPSIASHLVAMGDLPAEPDVQRLIARCAVLGRPEDFKRLHDCPCDDLSR